MKQLTLAIRRMMEVRTFRIAVQSIVLGALMCGYVSLLVPSKNWRSNVEAEQRAELEANQTAWLIIAAYNGDVVRIKQLIAEGAHANTQDAQGVTPLIAAASGLQHEAAALLLANGANPAARTKEGFSAYDFAHNQNDEQLANMIAKSR